MKKISVTDIVYTGVSAALLAICAWITIPLPSVPITLQTMGVCLLAALLGVKRGLISLFSYIIIGVIGVPVFSGFRSGAAVITGPTGGYLVGFIFTIIIVGYAVEKTGNKLWLNIIFMVVGELACYVFGTVWFMIAYKVSLGSALMTCVVPFLLPDAVKIVIAAYLSTKLKRFVKIK